MPANLRNTNIAGALSGTPSALQTIGAGGTITTATPVALVTATAARTGVILSAGTVDGQIVMVLNRSANSLTFAAASTSLVADGVTSVIGANRGSMFCWDAAYGGVGTGRWVRVGTV